MANHYATFHDPLPSVASATSRIRASSYYVLLLLLLGIGKAVPVHNRLSTMPLILSLDGVTIDGVFIGNRIYWTLKNTTLDYTLKITVTQRVVFSVTVIIALLRNIFQQWAFLFSRSRVLAGWRPSHTNLLLF
jgi:hypothetical protein